jgi:pimeloyl-ACP methyl ester carboxylesterase
VTGGAAYNRLEGPNLWPDALPSLRPTLTDWSQRCSIIGMTLLRAWARALGAAEDRFDDAFDRPSTLIKLVRYPGRDGDKRQGVGAHKDPGVLTLLMIEPEKAGLQVEHGTDWIDAPPVPGPHTLDAAARDLDALGAFDAVIGHSYGGKVALAWAASTARPPSLVVAVDSNPGPRPDRRGAEGTMRALDALRAMGGPFPSREAFTAGLVARGLARDLAAWLAMNVVARDGAWSLRTDVAAIEQMLDDYFARDLWPVVESPPAGTRVLEVVGGASTSLDANDRARLAEAAARDERVRVVVVPNAGHWVHVDAPDETVALLADALAAA